MNCKTCSTEYFDNPKSKYCKPCRKVARERWRALVSENVAEREERERKHSILYSLANEAGERALAAAVPTPMLVVQHASPADDNSPVVKSWAVPSGVCGFASVIVRPGNCSFALWLKKHKGASVAYHGGMSIWVRAGGQSLERKEGYAHAFADVLRAAGVEAYVDSRMD